MVERVPEGWILWWSGSHYVGSPIMGDPWFIGDTAAEARDAILAHLRLRELRAELAGPAPEPRLSEAQRYTVRRKHRWLATIVESDYPELLPGTRIVFGGQWMP